MIRRDRDQDSYSGIDKTKGQAPETTSEREISQAVYSGGPEAVRRRLFALRGAARFCTVSGIVSTRPAMIVELDRRIPQLGIITTKSYQVRPNPGNREPIIVEVAPGCFGNAVGLKNPGLEVGVRELRAMRENYSLRALLNVSISGSSPEEFVQLAEAFSAVADTLELNFSCPHAEPGYGMSIGVDPELVYRYMKALRGVTDLPLIPKLSPNVAEIAPVAQAAVEGGADAIAAINTVGPELYLEAHSGSPIMINSHGGRGGKSGRWVFQTALEKVAEIRKALGPKPLILGMGGVEDLFGAQAMRKAGADVVGIGSAFALVEQDDWEIWFTELAGEGREERGKEHPKKKIQKKVQKVVQKIETPQMEYRPFIIASAVNGADGLRRISLEGKIACKAGQFLFIWIPGVGEKPFSLALESPATFLVRPRGNMTRALCALEAGDTLYVRGVYGKGAPIPDASRAWVMAGGTGIAVAPLLAQSLAGEGKTVHTLLTLAGEGERAADLAPEDIPSGDNVLEADPTLFYQELSQWGSCEIVPDQGEIGRGIRLFPSFLRKCLEEKERGEQPFPEGQSAGENQPLNLKGESFYTIGPLPFMDAASKKAEEIGFALENIHLSIETPTRCGVGLCGECVCAGRLTCGGGTFFSLAQLREKGVTLSELGDDH